MTSWIVPPWVISLTRMGDSSAEMIAVNQALEGPLTRIGRSADPINGPEQLEHALFNPRGATRRCRSTSPRQK